MKKLAFIQLISLLLLFLMLLSPLAFASELKMIKASELKPGQIIVDKDGNEIKIEAVATKEKHYVTISEIINNLLNKNKNNIDTYTGVGQSGAGIVDLTGLVVGGGITGMATDSNSPPSLDESIAANSKALDIAMGLSPAPAVSPSTTIKAQATSAPVAGPSPAQAPVSQNSPANTLNKEFMTASSERDKIGVLIDSKKSWSDLSQNDQDYLSKNGYNQKSWDSTISSQTPAQKQNLGYGSFGFTGSLGYVVQGAVWAGAVATFMGVFGNFLAKDNQQQVQALQSAVFAGILAGRSVWGGLFGPGSNVYPASESSWMPNWVGGWQGQAIVGAAVAWLVYNSMYKKEIDRIETVSFKCMPWQAPNGGKDCELCNSDPTLPCSEYRCKSLGQSCGIINAGTSAERCVNQNVRDVAPPVIKPRNEALNPASLKYAEVRENPPGAGFKIKSSDTTTGCIKPYTPIEFGIQTNEPAQCKIDYVEGKNYSQMATYFGGSNLYDYNHTESLSLPSADSFKNSSISLQNGKELNLFIKCKDSMGNINEADYEMTLCVDPSDDTTPPMISATATPSESCVSANSMNSTMTFYVNEPAECRWSPQDQSYESMQNNMSCANSVTEINALQLYSCNAFLTGISQSGTDFYIRCKDQPGIVDSKRNTNKESYKFNLRSSNPLKMGSIMPNETIYGSISPMPVEMSTSTLFGCDNGQAICYYSTTGAENSFVQFFDTNKADGIHTQRLDLTSGTYTYTIKCVDAGGNVATNTTSFRVEIDPNAPMIARVYEEEDYLKIVTPFNSECFFSNENCDFFGEGSPMPYANSTTHITPWFSDKTYYIKCKDDYRSLPTDCSLVVKPTENFL